MLLAVAWIHSAYYAVTGVWPVLEIDSFMAITGRKYDVWVVRTVGALLATTGLVIGWAAKRKRISPELALVAIGQAAVLAIVDVVYVSAGRISPIYLGDLVPELLLIAGWIIWFPRENRPEMQSGR
jgi:hypothetical protein